MPLRTRRAERRTLTRVEAATAEFLADQRAEDRSGPEGARRKAGGREGPLRSAAEGPRSPRRPLPRRRGPNWSTRPSARSNAAWRSRREKQNQGPQPHDRPGGGGEGPQRAVHGKRVPRPRRGPPPDPRGLPGPDRCCWSASFRNAATSTPTAPRRAGFVVAGFSPPPASAASRRVRSADRPGTSRPTRTPVRTATPTTSGPHSGPYESCPKPPARSPSPPPPRSRRSSPPSSLLARPDRRDRTASSRSAPPFFAAFGTDGREADGAAGGRLGEIGRFTITAFDPATGEIRDFRIARGRGDRPVRHRPLRLPRRGRGETRRDRHRPGRRRADRPAEPPRSGLGGPRQWWTRPART